MKHVYTAPFFTRKITRNFGIFFIALMSFTQLAIAAVPSARTVPANRVTFYSATLNALVDANSLSTTVSFEYGNTPAMIYSVSVPGTLLGNVDSFRNVIISGLTPHVTYYYRVKAVNASGTVYGDVMRFTAGEASSNTSSDAQHSLLLSSNGTVNSFGDNTYGQLGDGTNTQRNVPVKMLKGAYTGTTNIGDNVTNPIVSVAGGLYHSLMLGADGIVYSTGYNAAGQLGNGTATSSNIPIKVLKGAYNGTTYLGDNPNNPIIAIAVYSYQSYALALNGMVYAFGYNGNGALGDGTTTNRSTPVAVLKGAYTGATYLGDNKTNPVIAIAAGERHAMALTANGRVYSFGDNTYGQLGDSTVVLRLTPISVKKGAYTGTSFLGDDVNNPITAISCGVDQSMALCADGTAVTFGRNNFGQLGINSTVQQIVPVRVLKGAYTGTTYLGDSSTNPIIAISSGRYYSVALDAKGTIYGFGINSQGQLGDGTTVDKLIPVRALKGVYVGTTFIGDLPINPIVAIINAYGNTIAIAKDGFVYATGYNFYGHLGIGTTVNSSTPKQTLGVGSVGFLNVLSAPNLPSAKTVIANRVTYKSATLNALVNANNLNTTISFEYGLTTAYGSVVVVPGTLTGSADSFKKVGITGLTPHKTYHFRVKAVNAAGTIYGNDMAFITSAASSKSSVYSLHTLVLDSSGIVYSMGVNVSGQLGNGTTTKSKLPIKVLKGAYPGTTYLGDNPSNPIVAIAQGDHSLALAADGTVYAFGNNAFGQLGDGTTASKSTPVKMLKGVYNGTTYVGDNVANPIIDISCGARNSMLLAADGTLYSIGDNSSGQLGDGTFVNKSSLVRVVKGAYGGATYLGDNPSNPIVEVIAGTSHHLALAADGTVFGFGSNGFGQLGDGTVISKTSPVFMSKGLYNGTTNIGDDDSNPIIGIIASDANSAILAADGTMFTVGGNNYGQLGDATLVAKSTPVRVVKGANYTGTTYLGDNPFNPIVSISSEYSSHLALMSDGTVYSFGYNGNGQLGNGNNTNQSSPIKVLKGAYAGTTYLGDDNVNPIVSISGGYGSGIVIAADGYVFDFGYNLDGQLGDNTFINKLNPVMMHGVGDTGFLNVLYNYKAPLVRTVPANRITFTSANLNALVDANYLNTTVSFEYGLTTSYGNIVHVPGTLNGSADSFRRATITGLTPHRVYHFRVRAINLKDTTFGSDMYFMTGGVSSSTTSTSFIHSIILDSNGIVYTSGYNGYGELGDGTTTSRKVPVRVLKGAYNGTKYLGDNPLNPIVAVAAGYYHSLALAADGTVYGFGYNGYGQLGDGTTTSKILPVKVLKGSQYTGYTYLGDSSTNPVIAISCGNFFSTMLMNDGTIFGVGYNLNGELGDGTTTNRVTAVKSVKGAYNGTGFIGDNPSNPLISICSGSYSTLAIDASGLVYSYGYNGFGQLGNNTATNSSVPVNVLKGNYNGNVWIGDDATNPIVGVASNGNHSLCLDKNGTVYSFGYNGYGQLGDGTTTTSYTARRMLKGAYTGTTYIGDNASNPVIAINAQAYSSVILTMNGRVYSVGYNGNGNLGDGTTINRAIPVSVLKGDYGGASFLGDSITNPIITISSGEYYTKAISANGYVYSFGNNVYGHIGDNTTLVQSIPSQMRGVGLIGNLNVLQNSLAPYAKTVPANRITYTSASLNALINANTVSTTVSFEYGLTNSYGSVVNIAGVFTGGEDTFIRATINNLIPHSTYYYRVKTVNSFGTNYGQEMSFITGSNSSNSSSSGSPYFSVILDSNGIVYTVGANTSGQLGDGTLIAKKVPVRVLKGAYVGTKYLGDNPSNPIISVAAGGYHVLALAADGRVYSFGYNSVGQLGDGSTVNRLIPVRVLKGSEYTGTTFLGDNPSNPIIAISCGMYFSMALAQNGTIYTIGNNGYGELGDSTYTNRILPVKVKRGQYSGTRYLGDDPSNPIISISTGNYHSLVVAADGLVYGVGYNAYGQLGNNNSTTMNTPVIALKGAYNGDLNLGDDLSNPILKARASAYHSMCLANDGTLYTMGYNGYGQLGDGTSTTSYTPVRVLKGAYSGTTYLGDNSLNPIVDISIGIYNGLALTKNGNLFSFGINAYGGLGDGTNINRYTPVSVLKGAYGGTTYLGDSISNPIVSITGALYSQTAITKNGYIFSFGYNGYGGLGDNTLINQTTPSQMRGVGLNGNLNVLQNSLAPEVHTVTANQVTFTSASLNCIVNANTVNTTVSFEYGLTKSYGSVVNLSGVLTSGEDTFRSALISGLTPHRTYHYRVKAVNAFGTVYGEDMSFITGGASSNYSSIGEHTLILDSSGIVYATGYNGYGQLGDGTTTSRTIPVKVLKGAYVGTTYLGDNPANPIVAVASGNYHSIALAADGSVYTFGYNGFGQLGVGTLTNNLLPVKAIGLNNIQAIASSNLSTYVLSKTGLVFSFGYNGYGQLGDSTFTTRTTFVNVKKGAYEGTNFLGDNPNNPIVKISSGISHVLALASDGTVYTLGYNGYGQLGDNSTTDRYVPVKMIKGAYNGIQNIGDDISNPIVGISGGGYSSLLLDASGMVYGVGRNSEGQLGDGTTVFSSNPVRTLKGSYNGTTYLGDNQNNPIVSIATGYFNSIVLADSGLVYTFGLNNYGQLGDSTNTNRVLPTSVVKGQYSSTTKFGGDFTNPIVCIGSGASHSFGISADGYVMGFGRNDFGHLGNSTVVNRLAPTYFKGVGNIGYLNVLRNEQAPEAKTVPANRITYTSAQLNGLVNASVLNTSIRFEYGLTTSYGSVVNVPGTLIGNADSFVSATINGLIPHRIYHFRVRAINSKDTAYGKDMVFITGSKSSSHSSTASHQVFVDSTGIVYTVGLNTNGQLGIGNTVQQNIPVRVLKGAYVGTTYLGDNPANPIIAVAAGISSSYALAADGSVYAFGLNTNGQLGDGTFTQRSTPVKVLKGAYTGTTYLGDNVNNPIISISGGSNHFVALAIDGTAYAMGYNVYGQLGDGTTTQRVIPIRVLKGAYNGTTHLGDNESNPLISISSNGYHTMALTANGQVYTFGYNSSGQLGDSSTTNRFTPIKPLMGDYQGNLYLGDTNINPIVFINAGGYHSTAIDAKGKVYTFGSNVFGQIGDGTITNSLLPSAVLKGLYSGTTYLGDDTTDPIISIASGVYHNIALSLKGVVYGLGYNAVGQLGDNTTINRLTPVKVNKGDYSGSTTMGDNNSNKVVSLSAGEYTSSVITEDGYVYSFGRNVNGQLGDNSTVQKAFPILTHGVNDSLYLNVLRNVEFPEARTVPATRVTYTSATINAVLNANMYTSTAIFEYGLTTSYGTTINIPGSITGNIPVFKKASLTGLTPHTTYHYRVRIINLLDTIYGDDMTFTTGSSSSYYSCGGNHTIILDSNGIVYTYGQNIYGQLGDGTGVQKNNPVKVLKGAYPGTTYLGDNPLNPIIAVASGNVHNLALAADGTVYAFGYNGSGQLGIGTTVSQNTPVRVLRGSYPGATYLGDNLSNPIIAVKAGNGHSIALASDGTVYTFGLNTNGQLGNGTTTNSNVPTRVLKGAYSGSTFLGDNTSNPIVFISNGYSHTLAIAADGVVYTFGNNSNAQLGDGSLTQRLMPVKVVRGMYIGTSNLGDNPSNPIIAISGGFNHSIALAKNGTLFAFGNNTYGQLGEGSFGSSTSPQQVKKGAYTGTSYLGDNVSNPIVSITSGQIHNIALAADGTVFTFGYNGAGSLGDGTLINKNTPVKVLKGAYNGTSFIGDNPTNPIVSITAGESNSVAISKNGYVHAFGFNFSGQLGDGTVFTRSQPIMTLGAFGVGNLNVLKNTKAPTAKTVPATRVTFTSAILNAIVNANVQSTQVSFEYGYSNSYGSIIHIPVLLTGDTDSFKSISLTGLTPHKIYHFRVRAINAVDTTYGSDMVFITGGTSSSNSSTSLSCIVVDSTGIVYTTGYNNYGQLGNGTTANKLVPIRVLKGAYIGTKYLGDNPANPIIAVAAGQASHLALAADGTVYSFGRNTYGNLGDGTTTDKSLPVKVLKGDYSGTTYLGDIPSNPIIAISAGDYHSMVLAADGKVYTFGYNAYGNLGDNSTTNKSLPGLVKKGAYDGINYLGDNSVNPIVGIAAGGYHNAVLSANGNLYTFGYNFFGQLGDSTNVNKLVPVQTLKGQYNGTTYLGDNAINPIVKISAGEFFMQSLALDGTVYSFGSNNIGQLGDSTVVDKWTPVRVKKGAYLGTNYLGDNILNPIVSIASGLNYSMALSNDGSVYSFGSNFYNQLSDGTNINKSIPVKCLRGNYGGTTYLGDSINNPIVSITAGGYSPSVIAADGYVYNWGYNGFGQVGDNSFINRSSPTKVFGVDLNGYINVLGNNLAPTAYTVPANRITYTSATLNAIVNANSRNTTISFEYGLTNAYGSTYTFPGVLTGAEDSFRKITITGLTPHRVYHFRVKAENSSGVSYGKDMIFVTGSKSSSSSLSYTSNILDSNGIVYSYGNNNNGQVGDSTLINKILPIKVLKGEYNGTKYLGDNPANPIVAISTGQYFTLALAANGMVYAFGQNSDGQLGDGTLLNKTTPVRVLKGAYNGTTYLGDNPTNPIISIQAGYAHAMALAADGMVYSFGDNLYGELGDSTFIDKTTPIKVKKGAYNGNNFLGDNSVNPVVQISSVGAHTSALCADGSVYSFGYNFYGELGDGTAISRNTPVRVLKGQYSGTSYIGDNQSNSVVSIATGFYHLMMLTSDGILYTVGRNADGALGDATLTNRSTPVKVLKGAYSGTTFIGDNSANPIINIAAGYYHSMALTQDGTVYGFGMNSGNGQLGDGTSTNRNTPVRVLKGTYIGNTYLGDFSTNPIVSIIGGWFHSAAIAQDGFVYTWGQNTDGELGDNSVVGKTTPIQSKGVNSIGNLNVLFSSLKPVSQTVPATRVTFTEANINALVNPNNTSTTISFEYGTTTSYGSTVAIPGTSTGTLNVFKTAKLTGLMPHQTYHFRVKSVSAEGTSYGDDRTFITGGSSSLYASNANHTIVVDSNGLVYTYGSNSFGQLGDSTTANKQQPIKVKKGAYNGVNFLGDNPSNPIIAVAAGENHNLALAADGSVYAFGLNSNGQLGDNTTANKLLPIRVLKGAYTGSTYLGDNTTNPIIAISCGASHSMALAADGNVYSFGLNTTGELGDGTFTQRTTPIRPSKGVYPGLTYLGDNTGNPIISIAASKYHSMVLAADGSVFTFGRNAEGQLGDNTTTNRTTAVRVLKGQYLGSTYLGDYSINPVISIAASDYRSAVLAADGTVFSFGINNNGQLGDSTTVNRSTPVKVLKGEYPGSNYLGDDANNPIISIALGQNHSLALSSSGLVYAYGANSFGALGDGSTAQKITPVRVKKGQYIGSNFIGDDIANPVVSIAGGANHSMAITKDGDVYAFGLNNNGQLGDSTLVNNSNPVHTRNTYPTGNLNVLLNSLEPSVAAFPATRVTYTNATLNGLVNPNGLSTSITFEYGLTTAYTESIAYGVLTGNTKTRVSTNLCNLIPGKTYHFRVKAVNQDGTIYGPDRSFVMGGESNKYSGYAQHNVLVANDGLVYGYGANDYGQLADSLGNFFVTPFKAFKGEYNGTKYLGDNPVNPIVSVARGFFNSIALAADGTVYTMGYNSPGNLGDNTTIDKMYPVKVLKGAYSGTTYLGDNPSNPIVSVAMGYACSYALAMDGTIYSFGWGNNGRLGDSTNINRSTPIRVKKGAYPGTTYLGDIPSNPIVAISTGLNSLYALSADGQVYSLGGNQVGQLGDGTTVDKWVPIKVLKGAYAGTAYLGDNPSNPVISISAGSTFMLALTANGTVYSFGLNNGGQLGDSTTNSAFSPVRVKKGDYIGTTFLGDDPTNPIVSISAGGTHSMALTADNKLYAFGLNNKGQLGDSTLVSKLTPIRVLKGAYSGTTYLGDNPINPIISFALSVEHSTVITLDGKVYNFGDNFYGELADNTLINKPIPVKALGVSGIGNLDLIKCSSFSSIPIALSNTYVSNHSDTDATGWRHYCTVDNQLLLSLKIGSSGAVISDDSVRLKLAANTTMSSTSFGGMITNTHGYAIFERRWDVKPTTQPTSAVGVKYYFTPKEYSDLVVALANLPQPSTFTNVNQLTMYKATSGAPFADPHTVPGVLLANGPIPTNKRWKYAPHGSCNHSAEYTVGAFSGGGGGGGGGGDTISALLPVELLTFKGQWSEDDAILNWSTASERNSNRFEIERSIDGINFTKVGTVKSHGNSTEVLTYMFNDVDARQINAKGLYYRLKQIDNDGEYEYSSIIHLRIDRNKTEAKVILFPNPFVNELRVVMPTSSNSEVMIQIVNVQGATMMNYMDKVDQNRQVKINTELLPTGVFILNVTQDGNTSSHKIIKE